MLTRLLKVIGIIVGIIMFCYISTILMPIIDPTMADEPYIVTIAAFLLLVVMATCVIGILTMFLIIPTYKYIRYGKFEV